MKETHRLVIKANLMFNEVPTDSLATLAIKRTRIQTDILAIRIFGSSHESVHG
jgi:hypothetical protein